MKKMDDFGHRSPSPGPSVKSKTRSLAAAWPNSSHR